MDLKTIADEFLGATNPAFAEAHPTECRELLHAFAEYLENTPIALSRSVTAHFGKPVGEVLRVGDAVVEGRDDGGHPHQIESHTLEEIDEEFRRK